MKKILILLLIFSNTLVQSQSKNVLFIGNSYTLRNNLPQLVADMASSMGDNLTFSDASIAITSLSQHSTTANTLNLIRQGGWNYVVLQEYSTYPSEPLPWVEQYVYPYAQYLDGEINTYNPGAETMFYMTWGRKDGDADRCTNLPSVCTYVGMDTLTRERYMFMAEANHAVISPVGALWRYIRNNFPSINLYETDGSHPSEAGSYAAACCFYTAIFRKDPTQITYNFTLNSSDAAQIKTAAKLVVFDSLMTWHIGEYDPDTQSPTVPTGLASSVVTETGLTLTWTASSDNVGVTGYDVYRDGTLVTTVASTSAIVTGLNASTTYAMIVRAKDAPGNSSSASSVLNVTTTHAIVLTVTGTMANTKVYDGTTVANLNIGSATLAGVTSGDVVNLVSTGATGTFTDKNAGTNKAVSASGFTLSGADAGKYTLIQPILAANITAKEITITPQTGKHKIQGDFDPPFTYTFAPVFIEPDVIYGALGRVSGESPGNYAYILDDLAAGSNYSLIMVVSPPTFEILLATGIQDLPDNIGLNLRNFPNPFVGNTIIIYTLPSDGHVTLAVRNLVGQLVKTIVNEMSMKGDYSFNFNTGDLQSGVYLVTLRLKSNGKELLKTIRLVKRR